ncbi:MAG: hypothetical protein WBB39_01515 [Candidatus Saccharimonadales bacterium]
MNKQAATIDDVLSVIGDLTDSMGTEFSKVHDSLGSMNNRLDSLEVSSRGHTKAIQELGAKMDRHDQHLDGVEEDIRHLYELIEGIRKDFKQRITSDQEYRERLEKVEDIAHRLRLHVGMKSL